MQKAVPLVVLCATLTIAYFTFLGDESYSKLGAIRHSVAAQKEDNEQTRRKISELRKQIYELQNDPRTLEKTVRNELGLARQGELIFIFENYADVE